MYRIVQPILKLLKPKKFITTSFVFRLQTKVTVFLLIMFSLLLSAEQYFGTPIDCVLSSSTNAHKRFVDNFCWTTGTYIYGNATGKWVIVWWKPCVHHIVYVESVKYLSRCFIQLQVGHGCEILVYLNHPELCYGTTNGRCWCCHCWHRCFICRHSFGNCMNAVSWRIFAVQVSFRNNCSSITLIYVFAIPIIFIYPSFSCRANHGCGLHRMGQEENRSGEVFQERLHNAPAQMVRVPVLLVRNIEPHRLCKSWKEWHWPPPCGHSHHTISNSLPIPQIANMVIINKVFLNFWTNYFDAMWALLSNNLDAWTILNEHIFPKLSKCEFLLFGPSGSTESRDALCLLSLNILNEKIFAILYIWLIIILILSMLSVLNRMVMLISKQYRLFLLRRVTLFSFSQDEMRRITNRGNIGDVFVMHQIAQNIPTHLFIDLMHELLTIRKNRTVSFCSER